MEGGAEGRLRWGWRGNRGGMGRWRGGLGAQGCPHLGDVHVGRVAPHGAVGLPVARVADQLRVPDAEIAAPRSPRGEDGDGGPGGREGRQGTVRPRGPGGAGGRRGGSHRMLPRLVANWMCEQRRLNISPSPAQSRASNTCGGTGRVWGTPAGQVGWEPRGESAGREALWDGDPHGAGVARGLCGTGSSLWNRGPVGRGSVSRGPLGPRATGARQGLCAVGGVSPGHGTRFEAPRGVGVTTGVLAPVGTREMGWGSCGVSWAAFGLASAGV